MADTSSSWFVRWLAMRNMSAEAPSNGAITACRENRMRASGREKRANRMPVTSARPMRPNSASTVTSTCAGRLRGLMVP